MGARPFYVVFAGVNGAGKSTLFQSGLWRTEDTPRHIVRINPDEILLEQGGDWANPHDQAAAGKEALARLERAFAVRASLNHETTLAGKLALKNIKRAHGLGYRVMLYYVGLPDAATAIERIRHRVETGGHNIDPKIVERRFRASILNLGKALPYCEEVRAYDNAAELRCIMGWRNDVLCWWGATGNVGRWLADVVAKDEEWRR